MRTTIARLLAVFGLLLGALAFGAVASAATAYTPFPTLTAVTFTGTSTSSSGICVNYYVTPPQNVDSFTATYTGTAIGPGYFGTFTETLTGDLGGLDATFTITSITATVSGTAHLDAATAHALIIGCSDQGITWDSFTVAKDWDFTLGAIGDATMNYTATITPVIGIKWQDAGKASLHATAYATKTGNLTQAFTSTQAVTTPADTTKPVITPHLSGTPGTNGWYTSAVAVSFTCADEPGGSGLATSATGYGDTTLTNDGANQSATSTGSCEDQAGNVAAAATASGIKIDKTAPTGVTGTPSRAANAVGWYNTPVTVAFAGTDATSGIASCTSPRFSGPDSATASAAGSCTDRAGNTTNGSFALQYDATPPTNVVGIPARAADRNGWYNDAVTVNFSGTDATSGLPATGACTTGASYSGSDSAPARVAGTCTDNAGNVGNGSFALQYDATAPTVTYTGNAGSYTADQTVSITCTAADNLSGVASSTCANISGPASSFAVGTNTYSAKATDTAGNVGNTTSTSFTVGAPEPPHPLPGSRPAGTTGGPAPSPLPAARP